MSEKTKGQASWQTNKDPEIERLALRWDEITDWMLQRWRAADIARADAAWDHIYGQTGSDVDHWLDNLSLCIKQGTTWSATYPVPSVATAPYVPMDTGHITRTLSKLTVAIHRQSGGSIKVTPARARREALYEQVCKLSAAGAKQTEIARQLNIAQPTVSLWLRRGI